MKHEAWNHPKLVHLASLLGVSKHAAAGVVEGLISFACHYAADGEVGKFPNSQLAAWLDWQEDVDSLFDALIESGWLDRVDDERRFVIHDWVEHRPYFLSRRGKLRGNGKAGDGSETVATSLDDHGQPLDDHGQPLDDHGQPLDDHGQPTGDHGRSHRTELNRTEQNKTKSKSKAADAAVSIPHEDKLDELIEIYESVHWLTTPQDNRAASLVTAWRSALTGKRAAEYRELLADTEAIRQALTKSQTFMSDKPALCRLEWLLKRESNGTELNLAKLLAGTFQGGSGRSPRSADVGPGKVFDPNNRDPMAGKI